MNNHTRLIALFGYETDGGRNSHLWNNPWDFSRPSGQGGTMLDDALLEWKHTKRPIAESEVLKGEWSKVGDNGSSSHVKFLPAGKLIERNDSDSWQGEWSLSNGVLCVKIEKYELNVFGNKEGNTHSGVEVADGRLNAYFKMAHEDNDPLGIR
jgi:hypothetical protein